MFNAQGDIWLAIHHFEKAVTLDPNFLDGKSSVRLSIKPKIILSFLDSIHKLGKCFERGTDF